MIKSAIEYVLGLSRTGIVDVDGAPYYATANGIQPIRMQQPEVTNVSTLGAVIDYIQNNVDSLLENHRLIVHIENEETVSIKTELMGDFNQRETLVTAQPNIPSISFGQWMDTEQINIYLQSRFVDTGDRAALLKCVGSITEENVQSFGDDGVSQKITAKVGVATVASAKVPNPVVLAPFRTFSEIKQPVSQFIFRMQNGPRCALFEADGGAWKVEAMERIQAYLCDHIAEHIEQGQVVILC